jgi:hypothetical protein
VRAVALLALLSLMTLLPLSALRSALGAAPALILTLDGGYDQRTRARIERQIAPLLDQRSRQWFGEQALGQAERKRLALAFVAAFVARGQRHHHIGARPGMIGHVLHGLTDAFAGMNAGENDRRLAGIGRRGDPRVDAEICRQHHALPVERRRDALPAFAAGGDESGPTGKGLKPNNPGERRGGRQV